MEPHSQLQEEWRVTQGSLHVPGQVRLLPLGLSSSADAMRREPPTREVLQKQPRRFGFVASVSRP